MDSGCAVVASVPVVVSSRGEHLVYGWRLSRHPHLFMRGGNSSPCSALTPILFLSLFTPLGLCQVSRHAPPQAHIAWQR